MPFESLNFLKFGTRALGRSRAGRGSGFFRGRAGRVRTVATETFHVISRRTVLKSEKDVRVDGEKIYLG